MNTPGTLRGWTLALAGLAVATTAVAQVQRSGGGSGAANAQLMMQYQQASTERAQLQADNAKLKKDLEDLKKQLDAANKQTTATKAGVSRGAAELAAEKTANERASKDLADSKAKMQEIIAKFRETITQMRGIEADRDTLKQQLSKSQAAFDTCAERNYSLYEVDNEVLDRYAHQGAFSYLERSEPFTRIKRTQIDNFVLEYKERAEQLRVRKATPPASTTSPGSATPPAGAAPTNGPPSPSVTSPAGIGNPAIAPNQPPPAGATPAPVTPPATPPPHS
jgi:chromosome segregation ATPase